MNDTTLPSAKQTEMLSKRAASAGSSVPTWWVVFGREMADLWLGGKALVLILIYCILVGVISYVLAANSELDLMPANEMVFLTLQTALSVGLLMAIIIGADSLSGERERATLEALLLTPTSRVQIVLGKYLAAISPWPVTMLITIPYLRVLAGGDVVFGPAVLWGVLMGILLSAAFTAFGMLTSIWSSSNRTSLGISLVVYLLCALPVQFPGTAQTGVMGRWLKTVNPLESVDHFLEKILVNNRTVAEMQNFLWSPIIFAAIVLLLLFVYAAPRLRLDGGVPFNWRFGKQSQAAALMLALGAGMWGSSVALAAPITGERHQEILAPPLEITIDTTHAMVKTGDKVFFETTVTNQDSAESVPLILAMNIINLDSEGDVVDPEDWSPERTQYLESLGAGESAQQEWELSTILAGDYMVYLVLIPAPGAAEVSSQPLTSPGIHVTVERFVSANPGGILPYAIGGPVVVLAAMAGVYWFRRRGVDMGDENDDM